MPTNDHNPTVDFTPPAVAPADAKGETLGPPDASGPVTLSPALPADSGTTIASPKGTAAGDSRSLPDIAGYVVEEEIARGGMGVVYRARHLQLNRPAAIKMILGGKYHDPTARIRFQIEAEAVAALDHPHVVHVHEFGTHNGMPYFALEFVGGGTLSDKAQAGRQAERPLQLTGQFMNEVQVVGFLNWITQDGSQFEYASLNGSPKGFWLGDQYVVDDNFREWAERWLTELESTVTQPVINHLTNQAMDKIVRSGNVWPPRMICSECD